MITPDFKISQEEDLVVIKIRLPYVKISASEVYVEKNMFYFYLKPYYLKLQFTEDLIEGDEAVESSVYDHDTYIVTFKVKKAHKGEHFKNLDIISKLFEKKPKRTKAKPKITVLSTSSNQGTEIEAKMEEAEPKHEGILEKSGSDSSYSFGFDYGYDDFFENHQEELYELADIDPALTNIGERPKALYLTEARRFDPDHYVSNFFDSRAIDLTMKPELQFSVQGKLFPLKEISADNIK